METARCRAFLPLPRPAAFPAPPRCCATRPPASTSWSPHWRRRSASPCSAAAPRGVALTANGQLLLPVIREILHQEDKLFELSAQMNGLLIGTVTIAAYSSIATHWLPAVIRDFQENYPTWRSS